MQRRAGVGRHKQLQTDRCAVAEGYEAGGGVSWHPWGKGAVDEITEEIMPECSRKTRAQANHSRRKWHPETGRSI